MKVTATVDYVNHDNYPSPIGIADLSNWTTLYGTRISTTAKEVDFDGTMQGKVTVKRAGTYTLTVQVDYVNVVGSPFSSLEVTPTSLDGFSCVTQSIDTQMYAGYDYSFLIQARDQYSNNISSTLSNAAATYSVNPHL